MGILIKCLLLIIISVLWFKIGYKFASNKYMHNNYDGEFIINDVDPNKDVISVGLYTNISEMLVKKELYFKVIHETEEMSRENR